MLEKKPKVIVVSFDGGVWSNLLPLAKSGIMPNLNELLEKGFHSDFESTIPPVTPPAWTAFMTGCNPGKTGIFDFYQYEEGSYKPTLTTSKSIQVDTLWKMLSDKGLRVGIVDVPINYPPPEVNGFVVSGWERPTNKKVFTYPAELGDKLLEKFGDYPICLRTFDRQGTKDIDFLNNLIKITKSVGDAALWLLETEHTDFFMVHFQTTDIIQHSFWNEIATFDFNSSNPVLSKVWEFYKCLDQYLGQIKDRTSSDGMFFLVSDHGFGPVKRRLATNVWLMENGYLKLRKDFGTQIKSKVSSTAIKMVNKVDALARLKTRIKQKREENMEQRVIVPRAAVDPVDYKETMAFSGIGTVYGSIQLNLIGREPEGIIPVTEAEALKKELSEKLIRLKDPLNGEPFIKAVYKKEEIFQGNALNKIPDLIVIPHKGFYLFSGTNEKQLFHEASSLSVGNHLSEGIIAVFGKEVKILNLDSPKIIDFAPTILEIFGIKAPGHLDGQSLLHKDSAVLQA